jgi:heme/copper-type cytochrome/quinol oxidase subunit 2
MLKFIKQNLETIDGVSIYPIISLVIFFTVFIVMLLVAFKMHKSKIKVLENLPLED